MVPQGQKNKVSKRGLRKQEQKKTKTKIKPYYPSFPHAVTTEEF